MKESTNTIILSQRVEIRVSLRNDIDCFLKNKKKLYQDSLVSYLFHKFKNYFRKMAQLKIKKTLSETVQRESAYRVDESHEVAPPVSNSIILNELKVKTRVPEFLKQTLKVSKQDANNQTDGKDLNRSKISNFVHEKVKSLKNMVFCQICQKDFKKSSKPVYICDCEHKFDFCESCLDHYTIYKVKHFEEVMCPHQGCKAVINTQTPFFKNLPIDIQRNYKKINRFYAASKDPNIKMCPKENCEGFIKLDGKETMICNKCSSQFCPKCLLAKHEGDCDKQQLLFFQGNLHYRQCKRCKMVIEKNQGCNHMTCRCQYQFCYVCGADWTSAHYGKHDDKGNLIAPQPATNANPRNDQQDCCQNCQESCCGRAFICIMLGMVKLFALLFVILCVISLFLMRDVFMFLGLLMFSIIGGIFVYSIQFISEQECPLMAVFIIFFPLAMAMGLKKGFTEIFCDAFPEMCSDSWELYKNLCNNLLCWDRQQ